MHTQQLICKALIVASLVSLDSTTKASGISDILRYARDMESILSAAATNECIAVEKKRTEQIPKYCINQLEPTSASNTFTNATIDSRNASLSVSQVIPTTNMLGILVGSQNKLPSQGASTNGSPLVINATTNSTMGEAAVWQEIISILKRTNTISFDMGVNTLECPICRNRYGNINAPKMILKAPQFDPNQIQTHTVTGFQSLGINFF